MLNSKTVHFILLGVILGSAAAYIFGSYQIEAQRRDAARAVAAANPAPAGHPDMTDQQMLDLFDQALEANPDDRDILFRYAAFLFDLRRYAEAADAFARLLEITPDDVEVRAAMATALYGAGRTDESIAEYQRVLESDPMHVIVMHNLATAYIESRNDLEAAEGLLRRIEETDPSYAGLDSLRARIAATQGSNPG